MTASATKDELHQLVDLLDDVEVAEALDYLRWLRSEGDELSPEELELVQRGEEEIARGEYVTLGRPTTEDDPLWEIVGMVGDEYDGPTDVASNKHTYLAEIYADQHDE